MFVFKEIKIRYIHNNIKLKFVTYNEKRLQKLLFKKEERGQIAENRFVC